MNRYEKQFKVNQNLCHVRQSNRQLNTLRWGTNETDEHIGTKLEVCKCLKRMGHDFVTEAIFKDGNRADVFDVFMGICYEIYHSEGEKSLAIKSNDYDFLVVPVNSKCSKEDVKKIVGEI